jgi:hypothetical protein
MLRTFSYSLTSLFYVGLSRTVSINFYRRIPVAREGKVRLAKPVSTASDENYVKYAEQFDPAGDRRLLANEILRLRKMVRGLGGEPVEASTTKPESVDDALI